MKYYLYVSPTKVNMLYPQIPDEPLKRIAAELSINLGIISATVKSEAAQPSDSIYAKLDLVSTYIVNYELAGTLAEPKSYFKGTLPLRRGMIGGSEDLAIFGGVIGRTILALIGSPSSVVGEIAQVPSNSIDYYASKLISESVEDSENASDGLNSDNWSWFAKRAACKAIRSLPKRTQKLEFLAKTLYVQKRWLSTLVIGTPIYVALTE